VRLSSRGAARPLRPDSRRRGTRVRACRSMPQDNGRGVVENRLGSPPLFSVVYPAPAVPRWDAEEGASMSINPVELTAHSAGFLEERGVVACGPQLTGSVRCQADRIEQGCVVGISAHCGHLCVDSTLSFPPSRTHIIGVVVGELPMDGGQDAWGKLVSRHRPMHLRQDRRNCFVQAERWLVCHGCYLPPSNCVWCGEGMAATRQAMP
jgi:hypothetical protein